MHHYGNLQRAFSRKHRPEHQSSGRSTRPPSRHLLHLVAAMGLLTLPVAVLAQEVSTASSNDRNTNVDHKTLEQPTGSLQSESDASTQSIRVNSNQASSGASVSHHVSVDSSAPSNDGGSSAVSINGKHYTVPSGGELHKTVKSGNSQTTVNVSSDGSGSTASTSSSTIDVQINSDTEASSEGGP